MSATGKRAEKRRARQEAEAKDKRSAAKKMLSKIEAALCTDYIKTHFKKRTALLKKRAYYESVLVGAMR